MIKILKGHFLVKKNAYKNWFFIIYIFLLAIISITISHLIDYKIDVLNKIIEETKELKSKYTNINSNLMSLKLKSKVEKLVTPKKLKSLKEPPYELIIE